MNEPDKKPEVVAEPDKVGPLGAIVRTGVEVRSAVLNAFRDALAQARAAAGHPDVAEAVHETRKALRRARAAVRLVSDALPRDDSRDLRRALRDARRLLSPSRDIAVLPGALAALDCGDDVHRDAAAIIESARAAAPASDETRTLVQDAVARVAMLPDVMAAALPAELDWDDIADGLARTYRDARRAVKNARRSRPAFHKVKRRSKELAAQLEVLAAGTDGKLEALRKDLAHLADELGDTVDEIMLRDHLEAHGAGADVLEPIDSHLAGRMGTGKKAARDLFDRGTKKFVRRVGKAMKKDHAPPAATPAGN